ncbi:MAG: PAS domain S-box protein [Candidatus Micrarchaeota archaeon]|nr:PAS domain S-box protein [Candidatus Micrarchaeota archaeon]
MVETAAIAKRISLLIILLGLSISAAYILDLSLLNLIFLGTVPMKFFTAVALVPSGLILYSLAERRLLYDFLLPVAAIFLAVLVIHISLAGYFHLSTDFLDFALRKVPSASKNLPSVPSAGTLLCFILITTVAILEIAGKGANLAPPFCYAVAAIGFFGLLGHIINAPALSFGIDGISSPMSLYSTILFLLWGSAAVLLYGRKQEASQAASYSTVSISTILLFVLLAISLIGISIGAYLLYIEADKLLTNAVYENLKGAAEFKADHIRTYLSDMKRQAVQAANRVTFSKLLSTPKDSPEYPSALASAQGSIEQLAKYEPTYHEAFLMDLNGTIVISSDRSRIGADMSNDEFFSNGLRGTSIKSVYYSRVTEKPQLGVSSPVYGANGSVVGVYAARINLDELNSIMQDRTGLGMSGEMVLIDRKGKVLTPLLYAPDSVLKRTIQTDLARQCILDMDIHMQQNGSIALHDEEVMVYRDYRNITVIGTHDYALPHAEWCIIAKIDESEALGKPRSELLAVFLIILVGLIISIATAVYIVSRKLSFSIRSLTQDVGKITRGELGIRLKPSNIREIQELTDSLNRILASLKLAILRTGMTKEQMGLGEAIAAKKEAEDRYRILYESSGEAIMTLEPPEWKFTEANPAALKIFGIESKDEFSALSPADLSPKYQPDGLLSSEKARQMIDKAIKEGSNFFEWMHRKASGEEFLCTVHLTRANIGGKEILQAIVRDVSSSKKMEAELKLYQRGFETSPNSKVLVEYRDRKPVIIHVNESFTRYYGYSAEEVLGKNPSILKSGLQKKEYYKRMWSDLLNPKIGYWRDEIVNRRKDGSLISVLLIINTFFDSKGKPTHFLADHIDISERKGMQKKLAEVQALQASALDAIPDSFFICDLKGRFIFWNAAFKSETGYSDEEISKMKPTDFFRGADIVRIAGAIRKGLKTGSAVVRADVITKDGRRIAKEFSGSVIRGADGKIVGFAGVGRTIKKESG